MALLSVRHATHYHYRKPVGFGEHRMMLRPLEGLDQRVLSHSLQISPTPDQLRHLHDPFGNAVGVARFQSSAPRLSFVAETLIDHRPMPAFAGCEGELGALAYPFAYEPEEAEELERFRQPAPDDAVALWARRFVKAKGRTRLDQMLPALTAAIRADFTYAQRLSGPAQAAGHTLSSGKGTCRDFAVLMIEAARSLGLAAQYVSGYIHCPPRPGDKPRRGGGHTHAWCRVYLPEHGWTEFDPTNGLVGNAALIRVAVARNPRQALPLWGSWFGDSADYGGMEVEVEVGEADRSKMSEAA